MLCVRMTYAVVVILVIYKTASKNTIYTITYFFFYSIFSASTTWFLAYGLRIPSGIYNVFKINCISTTLEIIIFHVKD